MTDINGLENGLENGRAKLSLDFDDEIFLSEKEEIDKKVRMIGQETGFISTAPVEPVKNLLTRKPKAIKKRRTRGKTGRTYPFNTKIKPETYDMICFIADTATEEEGRPVSLAEVIERAVTALEEKRNKTKL